MPLKYLKNLHFLSISPWIYYIKYNFITFSERCLAYVNIFLLLHNEVLHELQERLVLAERISKPVGKLAQVNISLKSYMLSKKV